MEAMGWLILTRCRRGVEEIVIASQKDAQRLTSKDLERFSSINSLTFL